MTKKAKSRYKPYPQKRSRNIENPDLRRNSSLLWKFHRMVLNDNYKWNWYQFYDQNKLIEVFQKLGEIEKNTFNEVCQNPNHHPIQIIDLGIEAQRELERLKIIDHESVFSFRLEGKLRVFCLFSANVMSLLWLDLNHEVFPSVKRHT